MQPALADPLAPLSPFSAPSRLQAGAPGQACASDRQLWDALSGLADHPAKPAEVNYCPRSAKNASISAINDRDELLACKKVNGDCLQVVLKQTDVERNAPPTIADWYYASKEQVHDLITGKHPSVTFHTIKDELVSVA